MLIKKVSDISIDLIKANPDQPRKIFGEEELFDLSDSIKEYGVIHPVIVKKSFNGHLLSLRNLRLSTSEH